MSAARPLLLTLGLPIALVGLVTLGRPIQGPLRFKTKSTSVVRHALILPEVQKHLDDAKDFEINGVPSMAAAHASLVLVDDEVTYAVDFAGTSGSLKTRCSKALDGALDSWAKALDDTISFRQVTDPTSAEVVIHFKPTVMMGKEQVAGFANWKRTLKSDGTHVEAVNFRSSLQIRTVDLSGDRMRIECIRHEIAHEIGHVLGLEDSETTGDLMGPLDTDHPVGGPLSFESAAVREIRDEAHRLRTDAGAKV